MYSAQIVLHAGADPVDRADVQNIMEEVKGYHYLIKGNVFVEGSPDRHQVISFESDDLQKVAKFTNLTITSNDFGGEIMRVIINDQWDKDPFVLALQQRGQQQALEQALLMVKRAQSFKGGTRLRKHLEKALGVK